MELTRQIVRSLTHRGGGGLCYLKRNKKRCLTIWQKTRVCLRKNTNKCNMNNYLYIFYLNIMIINKYKSISRYTAPTYMNTNVYIYICIESYIRTACMLKKIKISQEISKKSSTSPKAAWLVLSSSCFGVSGDLRWKQVNHWWLELGKTSILSHWWITRGFQ